MMLGCKGLRILRIHETKRYQKKFKNKTKQTLTFILRLFKSSESEFQSTQFAGGGGWGEGVRERWVGVPWSTEVACCFIS